MQPSRSYLKARSHQTLSSINNGSCAVSLGADREQGALDIAALASRTGARVATAGAARAAAEGMVPFIVAALAASANADVAAAR